MRMEEFRKRFVKIRGHSWFEKFFGSRFLPIKERT
jgi:hypothetical protein